jgi:hypothetical protein
MPNAPHLMHNRRYILKPPICRCPNGSPPVRRCPPSPSIRRAGSLNITSRCASWWRLRWHGACSPAINTPAPARSCPRRLQAPRQLAGIRHASPSAPLPSDFGRVGGQARCRSPGRCPHAADGPQQLRSGGRWLLSKCFPLIARRLLCAHVPHGWAGYASWRHATNGAWPLWIPATSVARRKQAPYFAERSTVRPLWPLVADSQPSAPQKLHRVRILRCGTHNCARSPCCV